MGDLQHLDVDRLIDADVDVNSLSDNDGNTLFHLLALQLKRGSVPASASENIERVVERALTAGIPVDSRNNRGETALHLLASPVDGAADNPSDTETATLMTLRYWKLLLAAGANSALPNSNEGRNAWHLLLESLTRQACCVDEQDVAELLHRDPHAAEALGMRDGHGRYPADYYHTVLLRGDPLRIHLANAPSSEAPPHWRKLFAMLLDECTVDAVLAELEKAVPSASSSAIGSSSDDNTLAHCGGSGSNVASSGGDVSALIRYADPFGRTLLHAACQLSDPNPVVARLLELGADVTTRGSAADPRISHRFDLASKVTPAGVAVVMANAPALRLLINAGADRLQVFDTGSISGLTLLHKAVGVERLTLGDACAFVIREPQRRTISTLFSCDSRAMRDLDFSVEDACGTSLAMALAAGLSCLDTPSEILLALDSVLYLMRTYRGFGSIEQLPEHLDVGRGLRAYAPLGEASPLMLVTRLLQRLRPNCGNAAFLRHKMRRALRSVGDITRFELSVRLESDLAGGETGCSRACTAEQIWDLQATAEEALAYLSYEHPASWKEAPERGDTFLIINDNSRSEGRSIGSLFPTALHLARFHLPAIGASMGAGGTNSSRDITASDTGHGTSSGSSCAGTTLSIKRFTYLWAAGLFVAICKSGWGVVPKLLGELEVQLSGMELPLEQRSGILTSVLASCTYGTGLFDENLTRRCGGVSLPPFGGKSAVAAVTAVLASLHLTDSDKVTVAGWLIVKAECGNTVNAALAACSFETHQLPLVEAVLQANAVAVHVLLRHGADPTLQRTICGLDDTGVYPPSASLTPLAAGTFRAFTLLRDPSFLVASNVRGSDEVTDVAAEMCIIVKELVSAGASVDMAASYCLRYIADERINGAIEMRGSPTLILLQALPRVGTVTTTLSDALIRPGLLSLASTFLLCGASREDATEAIAEAEVCGRLTQEEALGLRKDAAWARRKHLIGLREFRDELEA